VEFARSPSSSQPEAEGADASAWAARTLSAVRTVQRLVTREREALRLVAGVCAELVSALRASGAWAVLDGDDAWLASGSERGSREGYELVSAGLDPAREAALRCELDALVEAQRSASAPGLRVSERLTRAASAPELRLVATLSFEDRRYGVLSVDLGLERAPLDFDAELLSELASLLGFALDAMRANRQLSRSLQRERDRHTLALRASGQGSFDVDARTGRVTVSPEYQTILGYAPGELEETTSAWVERTHPDDRQHSAAMLTEAIVGAGGVYHMQCRQRTKQGEWRWVLSQGRVVERDASGDPLRLIGTISDISAEKRAAELLHEREVLLEEAQKIGKLGHWTLDRLEGLIHWSDETCRIFGFAPGEFDGSYEAFLAAVHPEDRARVHDAYAGSVATGAPDYEIVHRLLRHDTGEVRHVFERCVHERDESGALTRSIGVVQDITDRILAMEELEAVGARLREGNEQLELRVAERTRELERQAAALEASLEAIGIHHEGRWVYRNEAFTELFGEVDERGPWSALFEPVDGRGGLFEASSNAGVRTGHATARGTRGQSFEADVEISHLPDGSTVIVVRDITEHQRALRNLAEREARYRGLMEGASDAILTATIDGQIVEANRRAEALLGYPPEALARMTLDQLWGAGDVPREQTIARQIAERRIESAIDVPLLRADGTTLHADVTTSVIELERGPLIITSLRDATGRRQAERRLVELSEQLAMSLEAGKIGRWSYDLRTGELAWDARMYELYGLSPADFRPSYSAWHELVVPADREPLHAAFQEAVAKLQAFDARFDARAADGSSRSIQTKAMILANEEGEAERVFGINFDISSLVERERTLEQVNRQLELATRQKDEFLANMSHELRTPLNAILGMSESLALGVYGPLDERQKRALTRVEESGKHLLSLINDVLDLAKIEAGRLELSTESVHVAALGSGILRLLEPAAEAKGIRLRASYDATAPTISADPRRLQQVLLNLLSNAIKFTESGGEVTLYTEADPAHGRLAIHVLDTGEGISEDAQSRLFKPFSQLESTLTKRHGGTGLGLSIVKRLVEMHGGEVALESALGRGSKFSVSLPWSPARSDAPPSGLPEGSSDARSTSLAAPHAARVLVVEDNENNVVLLSDFLTSEGYEVVVARTGTEGVARAESAEFDVILMDVQMPEMDGFEATRRIRRLPKHHRTAIIALTSFAMPGDRDKCLAAGMTDYMAKPISLRALAQLIKSNVRTTERD